MEAISRFGFSVKLHQGLGLDLVRFCANFVNSGTHLFDGVGGGKFYSSFSCSDKGKLDRTLTRT